MSDYPRAPPYGASYGGHQPNSTYPPTYPNQPYPQTESGHPGSSQYAQSYDAPMSAYGYNQPPPPAFGAASVPSGVPPPLPIFQGWNQDPTPLPTYTNPQNSMPYSSYAGTSYNSAPQYPPAEHQGYGQNSQYNTLDDEGEPSGGEYDDTYAPTNPALVTYGSTQYPRSGGTGYMDTAQRAVYSTAQTHVPLLQTSNDYYPRNPSQVVHQPSDSFSSYNTSRSAEQNNRSGAGYNYNSHGSSHVPEQSLRNAPLSQNQSAWKQNGSVDSSQPSSHRTQNQVAKSEDKSVQDIPPSTTTTPVQSAPTINIGALPVNTQNTSSQAVDTKVQKSVAEARKEAQGAILNLYPFQVQYQNYVDEGFDETIVGRIFDDLGLPRTSSKSVNGLRSSPNVPSTKQTSTMDSTQIQIGVDSVAPPFTSQSNLQSKSDADTKSNAKLLTKPLVDTSSLPSSMNDTAAAPPKPAVMTDKERNLQMKMEALRKSREQRAQKAAAKSDAIPPAAAVPISLPASSKSPPRTDRAESIPEQPKSSGTTAAASLKRLAPSAGSGVPIRPPASQSTSQPPGTSQLPSIPGLFLTPNATSRPMAATPSATIQAPVNGSQRKRPVATDFDVPTNTVAPKRPFGQSRYETSLVIDVTDEELDSDDEDVAMDLESSVDHNSPVLSARKMSDHRNTAIQNLPVLTNFPPRKPFTPPPISTASSTPTGRKSVLGNPEVLQEKENAIEALRKKIAEAEAAKALRKARTASNGTGTPRTTDSSSDDAKVTDGDMISNIEASAQIQQKISITEVKVNLDQKRLAEARAAEVSKVAELQKNEADQKRLRREQIATDLPRVDAEVEKDKLKLDLLRAEMARIEATVQKNMEEKQRMADEMNKLNQDAEDHLQAEKDKLKDLTSSETPTFSDSRPTPLPTAELNLTQHPLPVSSQEPPSGSASAQLDQSATVLHGNQIDQRNTLVTNGSSDSALNSNSMESVPSANPVTVPEKTRDILDGSGTLEQVMDTVQTETNPISIGRGDEKSEDSPTADPSYSASESVSSPMEVDSRSPSYSPDLGRAIAAGSEREDDYEPPEATPPIEKPSTPGSPPFSPAPPKSVAENIIADNTTAIGQAANEDGTGETIRKPSGHASLLSDGVQLSKPSQSFTPYESPLKYFRAFRFHPEFGREVPGGLRSLTYSHKIDPMVEMCPWEMAGGACNDETCEYQHVRNIKLPDDDILKVLGSQDGFTGEQRARFIDGLKEALGAIRERKIRDFDTIAKEILAYRRRFLGDDSKVLALEGTTI